MNALLIAKSLAPAGVPDFDKIIKEGTQLSAWNREQGQAQTAKFIFLFLVSLNKYFNVVRPMSKEQMEELAMEFSDYTVFKFEDFIAFFECIKRQRFGQIRDRLDPATIWEMFRKYDQERDLACERMAKQKFEFIPTKTHSQEQNLISSADRLGEVINQVKTKLKDGRQLDS